MSVGSDRVSTDAAEERIVLFDLDGTILNPAGGITASIAHALNSCAVPTPSQATLEAMIGPPLTQSLVQLLEIPPERVPAIVAEQMAWYRQHGIASSRIYPGMEQLIKALYEQGLRLAIATQKPQSLAHTVLEFHQLTHYFEAVAGGQEDESVPAGHRGPAKALMVAACLRAFGHKPPYREGSIVPAIMVGDRSHDVEGARACGLACIGVRWGFAGPGELEAAGVQALAGDAQELYALLTTGSTTTSTDTLRS